MATPPDFTAGAVLTAAQMNKVGLWHVKTVTGGNGAASLPVTDVFSADFTDYRITISGGTIASAQSLRMRLGSSSTGYYAGYSYVTYNTGGFAGFGDNNATYWTLIGYQSATIGSDMNVILSGPFEARRTTMNTQYAQLSTVAGSASAYGSGFHNTSTSYTDFTIFTTTGNWTADITVSVYGYNPG